MKWFWTQDQRLTLINSRHLMPYFFYRSGSYLADIADWRDSRIKVLFVIGRWARNIEVSERLSDLRKLAEVEITDKRDEVTLKEKAKDVDIIITGAPISGEVILAAKELKMIQTTSVGYEYIDGGAAAADGAIICNVGGSNANSVVELCFGLILDLVRRISAHNRLMREGGWDRVDLERQIEIRHSTIGIIGLGAIGSRMAQLAKCGFDMNVLAYDPYVNEDRAEQFGARLVDLQTLMRTSDIISIHVPLTKNTRRMIGVEELSLMKPTAIIVNAARGPIVDEEALVKVLSEKRISGAGLDVYEVEPLPKESPLRKLDNVSIVPHIGSTPGVIAHMHEVAIENVIRVVKGQIPMNIQTMQTYYSSPKWKK